MSLKDLKRRIQRLGAVVKPIESTAAERAAVAVACCTSGDQRREFEAFRLEAGPRFDWLTWIHWASLVPIAELLTRGGWHAARGRRLAVIRVGMNFGPRDELERAALAQAVHTVIKDHKNAAKELVELGQAYRRRCNGELHHLHEVGTAENVAFQTKAIGGVP